MRRIGIMLLSCSAGLFAQKPAPRHIFNSGSETLTAASSAAPRSAAESYLTSISGQYGWSPEDLAGTYVAKEYRSEHNGVTHLVYKQQFGGLEVYNSDFSVNIDRYGRVINAGGLLFSQAGGSIQMPEPASANVAAREAVSAVNPRLGERFTPFASEAKGSRVRFARGALGSDLSGRAVLFGVNGILRPAWVFDVVDEDGVTAYNVVVDSATGAMLSKDPLTFFQSPPAPAQMRGLVFEGESPQPNPVPGTPLSAAPPYVNRTMVSFAGDPIASPAGWVTSNSTRGNNAVVGSNPNSTLFLAAPQVSVASSGVFEFPLELGPGKPNPAAFVDAANVNLFYWVNRAHDLFYAAGFNEAAGNYQQDNFNRGGTGGDPIYAYAQFGSAQPISPLINNAFYTSRRIGEDGAQSMIAMHLARGQGVITDGAYDAGVITHEYTHGVSTRLVRQLAGFQGGAMGEAWSDFFAMEFTQAPGTPADGVYSSGEYFIQAFGIGIRNRPYTTNLEINPLTYAQLGKATRFPQIHNDGNIWVEALWEVRANLIRQLGEQEGRRKMRLLVIDGMKLSPPAPSMVDARDAILLADRVGFNGASQSQIWEGFAKRGLGVAAQSNGPDTVHVLASEERPSSTGILKLWEQQYTLGETVRPVLHDNNLSTRTATIQLTASSGDQETLNLVKTGEVYAGSIATSSGVAANAGDRVLAVMPGDAISAYYVDHDAGGAGKLISTTVETKPPYFVTLRDPEFRFANEQRLSFRAPFLSFLRYELPFAFPYFDRKYGSVLVFSNGLVAFDPPAITPCTDAGSLQKINAIAPLWSVLRTNGQAQPDEDIYVSRAGDEAITFRWAAETETFGNPLQQPEPVNFAVTLFRDGRIQFHYGPGNKNLGVNPANLGCPNTGPTVGFANGHETFAQTVATHTGRGSLENAHTVVIDAPFNQSSNPVGILETPDGQVFQDTVTFTGIAHDAMSPVVRVDFLIDGKRMFVTAPNMPRPDFCAAQPAFNCPLVGFQLRVNAQSASLALGPHTLKLRATNSRGGFVDFPENPITFRIEAGRSAVPAGRLEEPSDGATVTGAFTIRGWAASTLRITGVDVLIDGVTFGRAPYGQPRPEVCAQLPDRSPNCPGVGFQLNLDPRSTALPLTNGTHTLQVRVQDETGRFTLMPETPISISAENVENARPVVKLDSPANGQRLSGTVRVSGHAYDPDGRVMGVLLLINGEARSAATYGRPRPEACSQLSDVPACPNIGFEMDLDTTRLPNGLYSLAVVALDDKGASTMGPNTTAQGINIFVEN
jgi:hypothetical protein